MQKKGQFQNDLPPMMYAFGDVPPDEQDPETVAAVDDLVVEYIRYLGKEAAEVSDGSRIHVEDVLFVLRKDKKKHDRVRELVAKNKQIERARQVFNVALKK